MIFMFMFTVMGLTVETHKFQVCLEDNSRDRCLEIQSNGWMIPGTNRGLFYEE